ncbi:hypothetical protein EON66_06575 [archaeon]|nr:MAG: hypothetical protein EON66_06575 [archaeon]
MASGGGSLGSTLSPKLLALQSAAAIPNLPSHTDANVRSIAAAASAAGRPVGSAALNAAAAPNSQTAISQHDRNAARKADMYAVGKLVAARAQRERQGDAVATQLMTEADGIPVKEVRVVLGIRCAVLDSCAWQPCATSVCCSLHA